MGRTIVTISKGCYCEIVVVRINLTYMIKAGRRAKNFKSHRASSRLLIKQSYVALKCEPFCFPVERRVPTKSAR